MASQARQPAPDLVLVVDKPGGLTSHDVVARVRRALGTRKVGHAGTLDPMATGVLVLASGRATRLLGHLMTGVKAYDAIIRLGQSTTTDDAEGETIASTDASMVEASAVAAALAPFVGEIQQVPSAVSAVKVDGRRAYDRVRSGEQVDLPARTVRIDEVALRSLVRDGSHLDVEVSVTCGSGTYVRAIARDLGVALGVGGHLTRLRRTRVGPFTLADAHALEELESIGAEAGTSPGAAARRAFPSQVLEEADASRVRHGRALAADVLTGPGPVALLDAAGTLLALYERRGDEARAVAVFVG